MIFADIPGQKELGPFAKLVVPALVTLIPAGITAAAKLLQDRSHARRSAGLTERICKLTKDIAELPELPSSSTELPVTPRMVLMAELNAAITEMTALHAKPARRIGDASFTLAAKVRSALLLYRPKGFLAFSLHVTFYLYTLVIVCFLISMARDPELGLRQLHPVSQFTINLLIFVMMTGIFSLPSVLLRSFAARIHRRQNPERPVVAAGPASTPPLAATPVTADGD
jgi:hypothetical protein